MNLKKIKQHSINNKKFFIKGFFIDKKICQDLIEYFEKNKELQKKGAVKGNSPKYKISDIKISTDISIPPEHYDNIVIKKYFMSLSKCLEEYKKIFPFCSTNTFEWRITELINIQKYNPKEGFFKWHNERIGMSDLNNKRHLVFMTYLNSLKNGGTEFFHQKLKLKAEQGLTVIWPADWTYTHKGTVSLTEKKYIATGWYSFI
jgi:prolyl 4-hydroxylase